MTDLQASLLRLMDGPLTWTTAHLAELMGRQPGRESNRKHSALVLRELCTLEVLGKVRRVKDGPPIVWAKV